MAALARLKLAAQALAVLVVAGLLALLGWKLTHQEGGELLADVAENRKPAAPGFELPRLDTDGQLTLSSLRGKVVLVNFWATWCDPCRKEIPRLQRAWTRYRGRDVVFLGIDTQDFRGDARRALRKYGVTYPNVYDGRGRVFRRYGGLPLPRSFVLDRQGRIVGHHHGELHDDDIERIVGQAVRMRA